MKRMVESHGSMMLAIVQVSLSYILCLLKQGKGKWFWHSLRVKDTGHLHSVVNQEKVESSGDVLALKHQPLLLKVTVGGFGIRWGIP